MKIKRFVAADMRQAIKKVREEQGPDAVILANRKVAEGVEIIAALDYDEEALYREHAPAAEAPERDQPSTNPPRRGSFADMAQHYAVDLDDTFEDDDERYDEGPNDLRAEDLKDDFVATDLADKAPNRPAQSAAAFDGYSPASRAGTAIPDLADARANPRSQAAPGAAPRRAAQPGGKSDPKRAATPSSQLRQRAAIGREEFDELDQTYPRAPAASTASGHAVPEADGEGLRGPSASHQEPAQERALNDMQRELKALRGLMENQLSVLEWSNLSRRQPLRVALLSRFDQMGVGSDIAESFVGQITEGDDVERAWRQCLQLFAQRIPVSQEDFLNEGGVIAVVGPTGVGKTTTVAKLAARFAMRHGPRSLALVTSDTYRIGAQEQLLHYARILGVSLKTANDGEELAKILAGYYDKQLVLIDTAGMSQRDLRLTEQFNTLRESSPLVKPYLVLSANAQLGALDETVRAFNRVDLAGAIITKLDEAAAIGGALSVACRHKLPIACIGTGQRVPEDLQTARASRLVSRAIPEGGWDNSRSDPETMAVKFGGGGQHAHG